MTSIAQAIREAAAAERRSVLLCRSCGTIWGNAKGLPRLVTGRRFTRCEGKIEEATIDFDTLSRLAEER